MPDRDLLLRAGASWLLIVPLAMVNGLLREWLLVAWLGPVALSLSGLLLALLVLGCAWLVSPWLLRGVPGACRVAGGVWLLLTLAFEFPLGHFVFGRSWSEAFAVLDVTSGNLMVVVLAVTGFAPCLAARLRHHAGRVPTP